MQSRAILFAILLGLTWPGMPTYAHHSVGAEFDLNKQVTLRGQVTKIEWMNPHVYLYVDVTAGGKAANWACETAGPNTLARQGWSRMTLKIGDQVTVVGYRARDGAYVVSARQVVLADGRKVFVGSPYDGGPKS
ncbi:MAG TPA: DUF6152 family protein [Bryobacteraceae bacterium]|jgi:hypothetical protein|nr:DUF6152 family protein [Bryobacteraceae bacterium]